MLAVLLGLASVVAAVVVSVGAVGHSADSPSLAGGRPGSIVRWKVPHGQSNAPVVPTSGGAWYGQGGLNGVACPSVTECVAVGADATMRGVTSTTRDGGATWTQGAMAEGTPALNAVSCANASTCVAVGDGAAARSSDAGATWTTVSLPTENTSLLSVSCPSATSCVSVGVTPGHAGPFGGQLLVTSDGGNTWTAPTLPAAAGALGSVDCPSSSFCVAVGASIAVSTDGAKTWSLRAVGGGTGILRTVSCTSGTTCVAIGPNPGVAQDPAATAFEVVTTDAGATWKAVAMPAASATTDVISCYRGASCQADGAVLGSEPAPALESTDGGATWESVATLSLEIDAVSAVSCGSATSCVFVGRNASGPVAVTSEGTVVSPASGIGALVRQQKVVRR